MTLKVYVVFQQHRLRDSGIRIVLLTYNKQADVGILGEYKGFILYTSSIHDLKRIVLSYEQTTQSFIDL